VSRVNKIRSILILYSHLFFREVYGGKCAQWIWGNAVILTWGTLSESYLYPRLCDNFSDICARRAAYTVATHEPSVCKRLSRSDTSVFKSHSFAARLTLTGVWVTKNEFSCTQPCEVRPEFTKTGVTSNILRHSFSFSLLSLFHKERDAYGAYLARKFIA
jgi:hypothetical protein